LGEGSLLSIFEELGHFFSRSSAERAQDDPPSNEIFRGTGAGLEERTGMSQSRYILLVDDEPAITESLAYALSREGFRSQAAGSLAEATQLLHKEEPALIILDLMLPDGNGLDWLRALRSQHRQPVIILSSHDEAIDRIIGLEMGADDYVDKPFSPREIVARVRAVLRRVAPQEGEVSAPRLRIDSDRYQAWGQGQALNLSRTEFELLQVFIARPGQVFPRGLLLDKIWGPNVVVSTRTVDVHIKSLRKKLVATGLPAETIETVRGVGYRLAEP